MGGGCDNSRLRVFSKVSGHFVQRPYRSKTISYNNTETSLFVQGYEVVPEFLQTNAEELFRTRILCTNIFTFFYNEIRAMSMFTFVDHTMYWKIDYKFPNQNTLSALVEFKLMISNDTLLTLKIKLIKKKHRGGSSHNRTPKLNNPAENQTVKTKYTGFFVRCTTLIMRLLIMRCFYYDFFLHYIIKNAVCWKNIE